MTAKYSPDRRRGGHQVTATQVLSVVIAFVCLVIVFNAYRSSKAPPPAAPPLPPMRDITQVRLLKNIARWKTALEKRNIALNCPYLGHDYVARLDLPAKRPVTLDLWDYDSETVVAKQAYAAFVEARTEARVASPKGCIVHVFDSTGEEVVQASQQGTVTSEYAPISVTGT